MCCTSIKGLNEEAYISHLAFSLFPGTNIPKINFENCLYSPLGATQNT